MKSKFVDKFNLFWTLLVTFIFALLAISNFFNMGRVGYNKEVLMVYGIGAVVGLGLSLMFGVFGVFKYLKKTTSGLELPFQVGHVSESNKFLIFSNNIWLKFIPHVVWIVIIIFSSVNGFQVWGEPNVYSDSVEFSTSSNGIYSVAQSGVLRSLWDVAVNPAFTEDMASFGLSAVFVMVILLLVFTMKKITKNNIFTINRIWTSIAILIACPLASIGLGFIAGFAQAHGNVAGQNMAYLIATFVFQTINLYVMWFTGLFLPLAHMVHNGIFVLGFAFAFSIAFMFIPIGYEKITKYFEVKKDEFWK